MKARARGTALLDVSAPAGDKGRMTDTLAIFERLYAAERALCESEEQFFASGEPDALSRAVLAAVEEARKLPQGDERSVRLYRLAMLCSELPGF